VSLGLTRNGVVVVVAAAGSVGAGIATGLPDLVAVGAALAATVVAGAVGVAGRPVAGERHLVARRIVDGGRARARLTLDGRPPRRWYRSPLVVHDRVAGRSVAAPVPAEPGAGVVYDLPAPGRGRYRVGPARVERMDALGLVRSRWSVGTVETLWVHPSVHRLRSLWPGGADDDRHDERAAGAGGRSGSTFRALRPYVPGDDVRWIHWPSTARAGAVLVREVVVAGDPPVVIVLDTSSAAYGDGDGFEDAVRVAASVGAAAVERGLPVRLRTTGGRDRSVAPTATGRVQLLDELAAVGTGAADPGLPAMAGITAGSAGAGGLVVVVTGDRAPAPEMAAAPWGMAVTVVRVGPAAVPATPGRAGLAGATSGEVARRWDAGTPR
jgi:uncharacterized protein (DUF58 family)